MSRWSRNKGAPRSTFALTPSSRLDGGYCPSEGHTQDYAVRPMDSMTVQPGPGGRSFTELVQFVSDCSGLLTRVITELSLFRPMATECRVTLDEDLLTIVLDTETALLRRIASHDFDRVLGNHGLANGDPAWRFKKFAYYSALETLETEAPQRPVTTSGKRRRFRSITLVFSPANVILRSVADSIPGVGGEFKDIKDDLEATLDVAIDSPGLLTRSAARLRHPLRRPSVQWKESSAT
jgi:hypothetical protein